MVEVIQFCAEYKVGYHLGALVWVVACGLVLHATFNNSEKEN